LRLFHMAARFLAIISCVAALAVPLAAKSWRVAEFQDNITVQEDGSTTVSERITLVFIGEWHGIHRFIPVEYPGPRGTNYTLFLQVSGVSDGNGNKLKYDSSISRGFRDLKIYIPDAVDTTRTVEIDYIVKNGIRYFDDHDEFYWNVTGNGWSVPIYSATALVRLPAAATGQLRAHSYIGRYGSNDKATPEIQGSNVSVSTPNVLSAHEGLTVDVYVPRGILKQPSALTRAWWFIAGNPIIFLPLLSFAVMFAIWSRWGKDPDPGMAVAPMYNPPKNMTPAEVGTLIDDTVNPRDITAILVDLAVRGYIKIREEQVTQMLVFKKKDYVFVQLKGPEHWGDLAPFERVMMENLFAGGATRGSCALGRRFRRLRCSSGLRNR